MRTDSPRHVRLLLEGAAQRHPNAAPELQQLGDLVRAGDVPAALNKVRFLAEKVLHDRCLCAGFDAPEGLTGWGLLEALHKREALPRAEDRRWRIVIEYGNRGSHYQASDAPTAGDLAIAVTALLEAMGQPRARARVGHWALVAAVAVSVAAALCFYWYRPNQADPEPPAGPAAEAAGAIAIDPPAASLSDPPAAEIIRVEVTWPGLEGRDAGGSE